MLYVALLAVAALIVLSIVFPSLFGGAWSPTRMPKVRAMLRQAGLKPGEVLYDLGAGDGRVLVTAAREFEAAAVGMEIDPLRYFLCRWRIVRSGLQHKAQVIRANFFDMDLSAADVVTFYLSQAAADRLRDKLAAELRPGARVVSHRRPIDGWIPAAVDTRHDLYVYVIGEREKGVA